MSEEWVNEGMDGYLGVLSPANIQPNVQVNISLFIVKQTVKWRPEHSLQVSQENKQ